MVPFFHEISPGRLCNVRGLAECGVRHIDHGHVPQAHVQKGQGEPLQPRYQPCNKKKNLKNCQNGTLSKKIYKTKEKNQGPGKIYSLAQGLMFLKSFLPK